ncbi:Proteasome component (PCI) domain-containing protein [Hirschfeldia incana]|nr:Proteasome component (PCI) domain-containing protein [Hirschfeldia incana]
MCRVGFFTLRRRTTKPDTATSLKPLSHSTLWEIRDYKAQLEDNPIVHRHLSSLYDTLLEQNMCRFIEPFSRVEIAHIAELIGLHIDHVEK